MAFSRTRIVSSGILFPVIPSIFISCATAILKSFLRVIELSSRISRSFCLPNHTFTFHLSLLAFHHLTRSLSNIPCIILVNRKEFASQFNNVHSIITKCFRVPLILFIYISVSMFLSHSSQTPDALLSISSSRISIDFTKTPNPVHRLSHYPRANNPVAVQSRVIEKSLGKVEKNFVGL